MHFPAVAFHAGQNPAQLSGSPAYKEYCFSAVAGTDAKETPFGRSVAKLAGLGVEALRRVLSAITTSLTALGNRANALFAQMAAALAFDRAMRDTAAAFNSWQGGSGVAAQPTLYGWSAQPISQAMPMPFVAPPLAPWLGNYWLSNPWSAFEQACDFWTRLACHTGWFLLFGYPMGQNPYAPPQIMSASGPGFGYPSSWRAPFPC